MVAITSIKDLRTNTKIKKKGAVEDAKRCLCKKKRSLE
jgi:hypothetical protein